jgi:hypothetical protein
MGEEFKFHLVNWWKVRSPIREGGIGIRNLRCFNRALLGKWLWRCGGMLVNLELGGEKWWRQSMGRRGGWRSKVGVGSHGRGL